MGDSGNVVGMPSNQAGGRGYLGGSGSSGGGGEIDRGYLDARIEAVKARNDSAFARLEAKIDAIQPGATWQQNASLLVLGIASALGIVFSVLAWGSDRFDSGVSAMGAIEETLDTQREINASQDARLDRLIEVIEDQTVQSQDIPRADRD